MGFLAEIVEANRATVRSASYGAGLPSAGRPSTHERLATAIRAATPAGAIVVEYKRASPGSTNPALPTYTAREFVDRTEPGEVAGYSCLATVPRFDGSPNDVHQLVQATRRPVLFKDFILDRRQLDVAARAGASAVLLIARLETGGYLETPIGELAREAHARDLEVLLEFHDRSELSRTADVAADMYGVNVRDLDTLRMEPEVALATLRSAAALRPLLGLSGVATPEDARRFWDAGVDGILVGSAVARSSDPGPFLRSLHRPVSARSR